MVDNLTLYAVVVAPLVTVVTGALTFGLLELVRPAVRNGPMRIRVDRGVYSSRRAEGQGVWTALRAATTVGEGLLTDLGYAYVNPPIIEAVVTLLSAGFIAALAVSGDPRGLLEPSVSGWHLWVQVAIGTVLTDFLGYWRHRVFHTSALWPVHAIHHSSTQLDWLSTRRFHPLNQVGTNMVHVGALFALGFSWPAIGGTLAIRGTYGTFVHANIDLSYGPLNYLLVSPRFHRWHHSSEEAAIDKNFATLFSLWDWLFGTAYLPEGRGAQTFGLHEDKLPESVLTQLGHPFEVWLSRRGQDRNPEPEPGGPSTG